MKNTFTLALFVLLNVLAPNGGCAQTFWSETFSDSAAVASGWTSGGSNAGPEDWSWTSDPLAGFQDPDVPPFSAPTAATGYVYFNSDANGENNPHDITLTNSGAPVDCSGRSNVQLRFHAQYMEFNTDARAWVGVSTDGVNFTDREVFAGAEEDELIQSTVDLALPEADGQPQVWLRFRWQGNWEYHWKIDDVELLEGLVPVRDPAGIASFAVYPNPATDASRIALTLRETADVRLDLLDGTGRHLEWLGSANTDRLDLPVGLQRYPPGVYLVRLTANDATAIRRLVVRGSGGP